MIDRTLTDLQTMFAHFVERAETTTITTIDGETVPAHRYRGRVMTEYESIPGFNRNNYHRHKSLLEAANCIVVERQGSRYAETRWLLLKPPTQDLLDGADGVILKKNKSKDRERIVTLELRLRNIERGQLGGFNVLETIESLNGRIDQLQDEVRTLRGELD